MVNLNNNTFPFLGIFVCFCKLYVWFMSVSVFYDFGHSFLKSIYSLLIYTLRLTSKGPVDVLARSKFTTHHSPIELCDPNTPKRINPYVQPRLITFGTSPICLLLEEPHWAKTVSKTDVLNNLFLL